MEIICVKSSFLVTFLIACLLELSTCGKDNLEVRGYIREDGIVGEVVQLTTPLQHLYQQQHPNIQICGYTVYKDGDSHMFKIENDLSNRDVQLVLTKNIKQQVLSNNKDGDKTDDEHANNKKINNKKTKDHTKKKDQENNRDFKDNGNVKGNGSGKVRFSLVVAPYTCDSGRHLQKCTVTINVIEAYRWKPKFQKSTYTFEIQEDKVNKFVGQVKVININEAMNIHNDDESGHGVMKMRGKELMTSNEDKIRMIVSVGDAHSPNNVCSFKLYHKKGRNNGDDYVVHDDGDGDFHSHDSDDDVVGGDDLPFAVGAEGILTRKDLLNQSTKPKWVFWLRAFPCKGRVSDKVKVIVNVLPPCQPEWKGVSEKMTFSPHDGKLILSPEAELNLCGRSCNVTAATLNVVLSTEHIGKGCDRDTYSLDSQRKLCGATVSSMDLLPSPTLPHSWTSHLPTDDGREGDEVFRFDGFHHYATLPQQIKLGREFSVSVWLKHDGMGVNDDDGVRGGVHKKEQIVCVADAKEKNREHTSLHIRHCHLVFLLRKEPDSGLKKDQQLPSSWRWFLPSLCDAKWHHYAVTVSDDDDASDEFYDDYEEFYDAGMGEYYEDGDDGEGGDGDGGDDSDVKDGDSADNDGDKDEETFIRRKRVVSTDVEQKSDDDNDGSDDDNDNDGSDDVNGDEGSDDFNGDDGSDDVNGGKKMKVSKEYLKYAKLFATSSTKDNMKRDDDEDSESSDDDDYVDGGDSHDDEEEEEESEKKIGEKNTTVRRNINNNAINKKINDNKGTTSNINNNKNTAKRKTGEIKQKHKRRIYKSKVKLYVDGKLFIETHKNPKITTDFAIHTNKKIHSTTMTVGACWMGSTNTTSHHFAGYMAGLSLVNDGVEKKKTIECMSKCQEGLQMAAGKGGENDEKDDNMSIKRESDNSISISTNSLQQLQHSFHNIVYSNVRNFPTLGHRPLSVDTLIMCQNDKPIHVKPIKSLLIINRVEKPVINLKGELSLVQGENQLEKGIWLLKKFDITFHSLNQADEVLYASDGKKPSFMDKYKLDSCHISVRASMKMGFEELIVPTKLIQQLKLKVESDRSGISVYGVDTLQNYERVMSGIVYTHKRAQNVHKKKFFVHCSEMNGRFVSNTMDIMLKVIHRGVKVNPPQALMKDMMEVQLPHIRSSSKHHSKPHPSITSPAGSATGVVVVSVVCIGFIFMLASLGVTRIRNAQKHSQDAGMDEKQEMEWDNSALTITVNPMQALYDEETSLVGSVSQENKVSHTSYSDDDLNNNLLSRPLRRHHVNDDDDDTDVDDDDEDDDGDEKMKEVSRRNELEWDDSTLSY